MTRLFDTLWVLCRKQPERFKEIALKILDYLISNPEHLRGSFPSRKFGNIDEFKLFEQLKQILNGELEKTGNDYIDYILYDWKETVEAGVMEIIDEYHDVAHGLARRGVLRSDSHVFGDEINEMVPRNLPIR